MSGLYAQEIERSGLKWRTSPLDKWVLSEAVPGARGMWLITSPIGKLLEFFLATPGKKLKKKSFTLKVQDSDGETEKYKVAITEKPRSTMQNKGNVPVQWEVKAKNVSFFDGANFSSKNAEEAVHYIYSELVLPSVEDRDFFKKEDLYDEERRTFFLNNWAQKMQNKNDKDEIKRSALAKRLQSRKK